MLVQTPTPTNPPNPEQTNGDQEYKLLSAIAPTVSVPSETHMAAIDWENKAYFKKIFDILPNYLVKKQKQRKF